MIGFVTRGHRRLWRFVHCLLPGVGIAASGCPLLFPAETDAPETDGGIDSGTNQDGSADSGAKKDGAADSSADGGPNYECGALVGTEPLDGPLRSTPSGTVRT